MHHFEKFSAGLLLGGVDVLVAIHNIDIDGDAGFGSGISSGSIVGVALHEFAHAYAAYRAGEWAEALAELRAARRLTGRESSLPLMADSERALGRLDRALALVGRIIAASVRASDFAARYGGEEFLILLPDTERDGALLVAEKLRSEIEKAELSGIGSITASLGVAVLPTDAVEADDLMRKADRALYIAKQAGRNRVHAIARPIASRWALRNQ